MDILRNIAAMIFYILFFIWLFMKMKNIILIKKLNCKDAYKEIKRNSKCQKISKYLSKTTIIFIIIVAVYLIFAIVLGAIALFIIFITLGGTAYVDTGTDSSFYYFFMAVMGIYFSGFKYIIYVLYITIYMFLVNNIYVNYLNNKALERLKEVK